jgi:hypothetical protein
VRYSRKENIYTKLGRLSSIAYPKVGNEMQRVLLMKDMNTAAEVPRSWRVIRDIETTVD